MPADETRAGVLPYLQKAAAAAAAAAATTAAEEHNTSEVVWCDLSFVHAS
jgi:hypothetical protein